MSTYVIVGNDGHKVGDNIKNVKVEIQERNAHGQFTQGEEFTIRPGEFQRILVHQTRSFQVLEVEAPKVEENIPE